VILKKKPIYGKKDFPCSSCGKPTRKLIPWGLLREEGKIKEIYMAICDKCEVELQALQKTAVLRKAGHETFTSSCHICGKRITISSFGEWLSEITGMELYKDAGQYYVLIGYICFRCAETLQKKGEGRISRYIPKRGMAAPSFYWKGA